MADDIEYITFDNDQLQTTQTVINGVPQPQSTVQLNGTIAVDYTTNTYTITPGNLQITGDENYQLGGGGTLTTDPNTGLYVIKYGSSQTNPGSPEFQFTYQTKTPSDASGIAFNANDGKSYFSSPSIGQAPVTSSPTAPVCFTTGTAIATARGSVRVEDLVVGDMVRTVSGTNRPVRWIGHRAIERAAGHERPVRIVAGTFGEGLPERDLWLSPGHPVLVGADADGEGGHLVPIMCLINGTTIERMLVDTVTYWHVELDAHDVLLAEGLPAESYLDWGDRIFFTEGADHVLANPDFVVPGLAGRCRPVAIDGPVVALERRRLDAVFASRLVDACAWPEAADMNMLG